MKPKYNHACEIAFEIITTNKGEEVTGQELLIGLLQRIISLIKADPTLEYFEEVVGLPYDTYELNEYEV